jgi:hypothetical protein
MSRLRWHREGAGKYLLYLRWAGVRMRGKRDSLRPMWWSWVHGVRQQFTDAVVRQFLPANQRASLPALFKA